MSALADATAGLTLVMCFGLLGVRQTRPASILLAVQSLAVATHALVQHQPLIAAATAMVDVIGAQWFINRQRLRLEQYGVGSSERRLLDATSPKPGGRKSATPGQRLTAPGTGGQADGRMGEVVRGAMPGIVVGAGLTALCQSCGPVAIPLAVVLLSILLAARRPRQLICLVPLVSLQNGVALAACSAAFPPLAALVCFALPLLFAAGLASGETAGRTDGTPGWIRTWFGWVHLAVTIGLFAATTVVPLNPLAAVFAPLIGAWGIADAWGARNRIAWSLTRRGAALAKLACMVLAVETAHPTLAWVAVVGAVAAALFPTAPRRWNGALLAFCAAGLSLFGLLTIPAALPSLSYAALFIGYAAIATVVPDLGVVVVILILRQTMQAHLPPEAGPILVGLAAAGLLACAVLLAIGGSGPPANGISRNRTTLLQLGQTSIVAVALGLGLPEARFAAVVLLIQLILTRAAVRISDGPVANAARAGLGGLSPFGVFPGLVLVLLVTSREAPWLLLPLAPGVAAMVAACTRGPFAPSRAPHRTWNVFRSAGVVPLALAFAFGFFAPDRLVNWLHAVSAGAP